MRGDGGRPLYFDILAGRGRETLPTVAKKGLLRRYGYSIKDTAANREKAIIQTIKHTNTLEVLRHLNLIRNYTAEPANKKILSRDVKYISMLHKKYKKDNGVSRSRSRSKSKKKSRSRKRSKK